jgi:two-component system chemotaxis response regulator CheB
MGITEARVTRGILQAGRKIRVLVVDDSIVVRHLLQKLVAEDPELEFVGGAVNGVDALSKIPIAKPDVVTLDIEMPEMDGLETLRHIRNQHPRLRTILFSSLTTRGAAATFEALSLGADDYVAKASSENSLDHSLTALRGNLLPRIKQFFLAKGATGLAAATRVPPRSSTTRWKPKILAVGVSTGGPQALAALIPKLPADFPVPVVVVQHMPAMFTRLLAERLHAASRLRVEEASQGMAIAPGRVLIAPGDYHLRVRRVGPASYVTAIDQGPHENSCRPSVDVLFRSLAETYGGDVLSVVLTGMGSDGLSGAQKLKEAGGYVIAQDEASSVVWGMPGAVAKAGLADRILPLDQILPDLIRRVLA